MKTFFMFVAVLLAAVTLSGCPGSGEGLDSNGRPVGEAAQLPLVAEFESIQAHVFTPICSLCHVGALAPEGLRLDAVNSYNMLVGVPSNQVSSILRVRPGDPNNSYIIQKLEGTAAVGVRMPEGGPYLPASTIAVIRQWISDGALRSAAVTADAFNLNTAAPANGEVINAAPAQIVLGFNLELDATRTDATTVRLERLESGDPDAAATAIPATVSIPAGNPRALLVKPREPLAAGHYRVVLAGPYAGVLTDLAGRRPTIVMGANGDQIATRFVVENPQQ